MYFQCISNVFLMYSNSPAPKASSPAHSQKGVAEGSTSLTPSGEKHDREDAGTPTSSAGPGLTKQGSTSQRPR